MNTETRAALPTHHLTPPALLGVQIARTILTGDVGAARTLRNGRTAWRVCEARAIVGAVREANRRWGCGLSAAEMMGWPVAPPAAVVIAKAQRRKPSRAVLAYQRAMGPGGIREHIANCRKIHCRICGLGGSL